MNEYQDQIKWYRLYALHPEARDVFQRQEFIQDFDTWEEAEEYAVDNIPEGIEYRIMRTYGWPD